MAHGETDTVANILESCPLYPSISHSAMGMAAGFTSGPYRSNTVGVQLADLGLLRYIRLLLRIHTHLHAQGKSNKCM